MIPASAPELVILSTPDSGAGVDRNRWQQFRTFFLNAPVIVLKQHLFCCILFPLLSSVIGGSLGAWLRTERAEIIAGTVAVPLITLGVMIAEQWWVNSRFHSHKDDDHMHDHNLLTLKRYLIQTVIGYAVFFTAHALLP
jgi:hypothetical protein